MCAAGPRDSPLCRLLLPSTAALKMGIRYVVHHHASPSSSRSRAPLQVPDDAAAAPVAPQPERAAQAPEATAAEEFIFVVTAHKSTADESLGIEMRSEKLLLKGELRGVTVKALDATSPLQGALHIGDTLVSINGRPALGANIACELLREAVGEVIFVAVRARASPVRHLLVPAQKGGKELGVTLEAPNNTYAVAPRILVPGRALSKSGARCGDSLLAVNGLPPLGGSPGASQLLSEANGSGLEVRATHPANCSPHVPLAQGERPSHERAPPARFDVRQMILTVLDYGRKDGRQRWLPHHPDFDRAIGASAQRLRDATHAVDAAPATPRAQAIIATPREMFEEASAEAAKVKAA